MEDVEQTTPAVTTQNTPQDDDDDDEPREYVLSHPVKVNAPESFNGERAKLQTFLTQVDLYLLFNSDKFNDEPSKVVFAASYLRGTAFEWFSTHLQDYIANRYDADVLRDTTKRIFGRYASFKALMQQTFGDIDEERTAERKLLYLKQTGSASSYAAEFQRWAIKTKWDDAAQSAKFYQGLKDTIKDEIVRTERPGTLQRMIEVATRIDNRQYERQLEKKGQYRPIVSTRVYRAVPKEDPYGPRPMELDAIQTKGEKRKETRKCYQCGKIGHLAKNCHQRKKQVNHAGKKWPKKRGAYDATGVQRPPRQNKQVNGMESATEHGALSWTACYDDDCTIHLGAKDGAGWFPKRPRRHSLTAMTTQERNQKLQQIERLQERVYMDDWHLGRMKNAAAAQAFEQVVQERKKEILAIQRNLRQDEIEGTLQTNEYFRVGCEARIKATGCQKARHLLKTAEEEKELLEKEYLELENENCADVEVESLISSFKELENDGLDTTRYREHEREVFTPDSTVARTTTWIESVEGDVRDRATQTPIQQETCKRNYWKACTEHTCRDHLWEKRNRKFFPGIGPVKVGNRSNDKQCDKEHWEICFVDKC